MQVISTYSNNVQEMFVNLNSSKIEGRKTIKRPESMRTSDRIRLIHHHTKGKAIPVQAVEALMVARGSGSGSYIF
jgi:hypothetical protein